MTSGYLDMMADSLDRKILALQEIAEINRTQKELFAAGEQMDEDAFDASVERKGVLIDEIDRLNDGFQSLFDHVREEIGQNRARYAAQIRNIQEKIRSVTALSGEVEAQEKRNKAAADRYFSEARGRLKEGKRTSGAAMLYYQNMSKSANVQPQFFDSKK